MKRHIPGLHSRQQDRENLLEGLFLVLVDSASYRWHPQKPFLSLRFVVLEPEAFAERSFSGRLYCTERALWKLNWFLRDFRYDSDLLNQTSDRREGPAQASRDRADTLCHAERSILSKPRSLCSRNGVGRAFVRNSRREAREGEQR
jgi:hypothetical protein